MSPLARGLVNMELHRGDGSLGTFLGVQSGLAMKSIDLLGSEEQKERWLPAMARLEAIGAFALTEPAHGSDSVALETSARRDGDGWVLDGAKRWIGNGSIADVVVVWARSAEDGQVKGFLVETDTPGFEATTMEGKGASRAIWQADIRLDGVRVPEESRLSGRRVVQGRRPRARHDAHDVRVGRARPRGRGLRRRADLQQAAHAVRQAAVPLPDRPGPARARCSPRSRACSSTACSSRAWRRAAGSPTRSPGWPSSTTRARPAQVIAEARDLLGGNGVLLENHVIRHMGDIEVIHTYEGTETMQTLIVGRDITGVGAFAS